jgi:glutamate--cysteine ligase
VKDWTATERENLRSAVPKAGLDAMVKGRTVSAIAADCLKLSRAGLEARDRRSRKGKSEASFLDVLDETVTSGMTAADHLIELYHGDWKGDVSRVFRDFAY